MAMRVPLQPGPQMAHGIALTGEQYKTNLAKSQELLKNS